jgi:hypothetical protein
MEDKLNVLREGRIAESIGVEEAQEKVPVKGISRNTSGRLGMEKISMVFEDKLIESTSGNGLGAVQNEQGEAHERRKTMITEDHSEGS